MNSQSNLIDITYDVRLDSEGKDPDFASSTLRRFHKVLWSKALPSGEMLDLVENMPNHYLLGKTKSLEISLSSDTMCNSYVKRKRMQSIVQPHLDQIEIFRKYLYSVGGFILFPAKKVEGLNTINQERGWLKTIDDRFDLTLECIKLYYQGYESPLYKVLSRYKEFFDLFINFKGYIEFFLLHDLVDDKFESVKFFLPGGISTQRKAIPETSEEYLEFMQNAQSFLVARNQRILNWVNVNTVKKESYPIPPKSPEI